MTIHCDLTNIIFKTLYKNIKLSSYLQKIKVEFLKEFFKKEISEKSRNVVKTKQSS